MGKLTASMARIVMGGLNTDGLKTYVCRLAGERVYGDLCEASYQSKAMERGDQLESDALDWYEFNHDVPIVRQQHIDHPTIPMVAATPDGIADDHVVEAKSPLFHTWAETKERRTIPAEYRWQCAWQAWCAGKSWGRFVAYHPTHGGQGVVVPFELTKFLIEEMTERVVIVEALIRNWVEVFRG